jgi:hypothetical protein
VRLSRVIRTYDSMAFKAFFQEFPIQMSHLALGKIRISGVLACAALLSLSACLSPKYKRADKNTPPVQPINAKFPTATLNASLYTEISYGSPGSWKREAYWDEYVVTLRNDSDRSLEISSATLLDYAGAARNPGSDPWKLERESKTLEKQYRDAGVAFARVAAPRVIAATTEPTLAASAGLSAGGAASAAALTAVAIPVYGATVLGINLHNRSAIKKEFDRRRLSLPLTLGAGESRTGSLFFPMTPNPRSLTLIWSGPSGSQPIKLDLHFLEGLHVKSPDAQSHGRG